MFAIEEITFATRYALSRVTDEGIYALGGQLAIVVNGELIVDIGIGHTGDGRDLEPNNLHNVYCLFKPMVYLLLGHTLETSGYDPDVPLDEIVDMPTWSPEGLTYRKLAAHDTALGEPSAAAWKMADPDAQEDLLSLVNRSIGPAYSEISGGLLAELVIEQLTGQSPNHYCVRELLGPLGLLDQVIIEPARALAAHDRIRAPITGLPVDPLPMLSELLPLYLSETRLAVGALATMRGMAQVYTAVGQVLSGDPQPGLPSPSWLKSLLGDQRPFRDDPIFQRPARWAAGLMTDIGQQNISRLAGPGSIGHTGGLANTVALYDPSRKASIALYLNGVGTEREDHILPRMQIIDTVINAFPTC